MAKSTESKQFCISLFPCFQSGKPLLLNKGTVKPVCNDHLYDKINYLWFIQ